MPDLNALRINGATYELPSLNAIKINGVTYGISGGASAKYAKGTFSTQTGSAYSINLGFKPKYLAISRSAGSTASGMNIYNEDYSTTVFRYATGSIYATDVALGGSASGRLKSINSDGFTMNTSASVTNMDYFAIG